MAIIKPSKKFAGSEMSSGDGGKYILPGTRQVVFNKSQNKDGTYLYFLPAYKADASGNGVWFKVIRVRDNFGDKFKDKYAILDGVADPVAHFERNFKLYYPEDAAVVDEVNEKTGRTQKRYPNYGRVTSRVIFNVAYSQKLEEGCHVLDLPAYNGANILTKWLEGKDNRGRERPMINDPARCIPVFVKLNDGGGAPWEITPDPTDPAELPEQLADSDYLYNLDDIYVVKTAQEKIAKLKEMYTAEIFDQCMAGYAGFEGEKMTSRNNPVSHREDDEIPMTHSEPEKPAVRKAPALANIPKVRTGKAPVVTEEPAQAGKEYVSEDSNPLAGVSDDAIQNFLKK